MSTTIQSGNVEPRGLEEEMRSSYLDYAMSVIVGRALPDVRDGLKPVHRRALFSMHENGLQPNRPYVKSARIVGDVMGKYHPHGDSAIYDTIVRMAQDFSLRYPLVDGQGNFGSVDDDPAAAMRYTEARLAPIARELLRDLDADTVDFGPNYDGSEQEPLVLPARFPNLLVNGSSGIAVGMATNIPPHNLKETIAATIAFIDNPDIDTTGLMQHIKGPDFPTGGVILGLSGIRDAYETGRGRVRVRATAHYEQIRGNREAIVVTELPFMVKKGGDGGVIRKIAELVAEKKLTEISDVQDHSDRNGMRVVIELKRDANPKVVLNKLYKHTPMQTTFGVNMVSLVENVPRLLGLKDVIKYYVRHQREVIVRRAKHELKGLERRVHVLEGLLIALDHIDAIIALIRSSRDRDTARTGLMERFELSYVQAQAILELRLQQLTGLEADTLRQEHSDKMERIRELKELLGNEDMVLELIKTELTEISDRYGDERRTKIAPSEDDIDIEDLIADQQMVISITNTGYIKSLPLATYRAQRRGGVGIIGMDMKDEDFIEHLFVSSTHDYLLFFTNRGKVYRSKVYDLPEMSRTSKGRFLGNVLPLREGERVQSVLATRDFSEAPYIMFATRNGTVKKTAFQAYNTPIRADGIIAINIREDDELVAVRRVDEEDEILIVSHAGLAVRFKESDARAMGRDTSGVRGMDVADKDNYVLAMDVARPGQDLLVVTEGGYGKRTSVDEYRLTSRGAKGVKTITFTETKGLLAGALVVREHEELVFISQNGMVQRTSVRGINRYGRASQGVKVMNLRAGDSVSAVALVVESESSTTAAVPDEELPIQIDVEEGGAEPSEPVSEDTPETPSDDQDGQETT
ncbi:DNA gyrase subunit A [Solirubrobacter phytolaccae]|uniref:DNA gyrase subunit A n=1 Tax=Solirubrobacter phytolaccae TaxID=1404360 RepID=A0A9X3SIF8_9ACTN|nr:DNA gyrase subunit A [Solirubrobacter phytolaccae]MDA0184247.1 DNA gyrase subunit A [Solirubrobacter phytolaccae]